MRSRTRSLVAQTRAILDLEQFANRANAAVPKGSMSSNMPSFSRTQQETIVFYNVFIRSTVHDSAWNI
jgi:hypothetical protein